MKTFRIQNEKCHECDSCHYKFNERYESTYGGYVSDCSYTVDESDYIVLKPLYSPYSDEPCWYDDVILINKNNEQEIILDIKGQEGHLCDILEEIIDYPNMTGDEDSIYNAISEYYEKMIKEGG